MTGTAPIANERATVTVNRLDCGTNYTIIAGGTLNGVLVGPRSSHGNTTTNPCPSCPVVGNAVRDCNYVELCVCNQVL